MQLKLKMNYIKLSLFFRVFLLTLLMSCYPEKEPESVARVNNKFLFKSELQGLIPENTSKDDSLSFVLNYINQWAKQELLIDKALVNISNEKQNEFQKLIEQYKRDLYINAYIEQIVKRGLDTIVTQNQMISYYNENKNSFRNNNTLTRLRYILLPKNHSKFDLILQKFKSNPSGNQDFWNTHQMQFKASALNDSIWIDMNQVFQKLPFINPENKEDYLKSGYFFQHTDSLDVYLVKVNQVLPINSISPFEYIKPTLKEVIINSRQRELIKKFEKEIIEDAIKSKKYEIF